MKDITIKIIGKRYNGETAEDEMEFISDGTMYERGGAVYYIYEESEFSGMPGCKTSLKVSDGRVRMKRIGGGEGAFGAELTFEKGKRFISRYITPYGPIDMEVMTNRVDADLDPEGFGKIRLDYSICMEGMGEGRNEVDIEIMQ